MWCQCISMFVDRDSVCVRVFFDVILHRKSTATLFRLCNDTYYTHCLCAPLEPNRFVFNNSLSKVCFVCCVFRPIVFIVVVTFKETTTATAEIFWYHFWIVALFSVVVHLNIRCAVSSSWSSSSLLTKKQNKNNTHRNILVQKLYYLFSICARFSSLFSVCTVSFLATETTLAVVQRQFLSLQFTTITTSIWTFVMLFSSHHEKAEPHGNGKQTMVHGKRTMQSHHNKSNQHTNRHKWNVHFQTGISKHENIIMWISKVCHNVMMSLVLHVIFDALRVDHLRRHHLIINEVNVVECVWEVFSCEMITKSQVDGMSHVSVVHFDILHMFLWEQCAVIRHRATAVVFTRFFWMVYCVNNSNCSEKLTKKVSLASTLSIFQFLSLFYV